MPTTISAAAATTVEGTLFTACPVTNLVAINTGKYTAPTAADSKPGQPTGEYHIIPISRIQSFQLLSLANGASDGSSFTDALPAIHPLDVRALRNREATVVSKLQGKEARRGKGVTGEAQELFDRFSRTMPTRWDGTSIVVADAVTVSPPYSVDDCRPLVAGDKAALARVRKVVGLFSTSISSLEITNQDIKNSFKWNDKRLNSAMPAMQ